MAPCDEARDRLPGDLENVVIMDVQMSVLLVDLAQGQRARLDGRITQAWRAQEKSGRTSLPWLISVSTRGSLWNSIHPCEYVRRPRPTKPANEPFWNSSGQAELIRTAVIFVARIGDASSANVEKFPATRPLPMYVSSSSPSRRRVVFLEPCLVLLFFLNHCLF